DAIARYDQRRCAARPRGRSVLRALPGNAGARPRLRRGLLGRCGCQFCHDRVRWHRRSAGHRRNRAVFPGRLRSADGFGQEGHCRAGLASEADCGVNPRADYTSVGRVDAESCLTPRLREMRSCEDARGALICRPLHMIPTGILETVLYAKDLAAAEAFYRDALGMQPFAKMAGRHLFYRCGNQVLLVFNPDATKVPPAPGSLPVPPHGMEGEGHVCYRAAAAQI